MKKSNKFNTLNLQKILAKQKLEKMRSYFLTVPYYATITDKNDGVVIMAFGGQTLDEINLKIGDLKDFPSFATIKC